MEQQKFKHLIALLNGKFLLYKLVTELDKKKLQVTLVLI